jgi:hypothetical protein
MIIDGDVINGCRTRYGVRARAAGGQNAAL